MLLRPRCKGRVEVAGHGGMFAPLPCPHQIETGCLAAKRNAYSQRATFPWSSAGAGVGVDGSSAVGSVAGLPPAAGDSIESAVGSVEAGHPSSLRTLLGDSTLTWRALRQLSCAPRDRHAGGRRVEHDQPAEPGQGRLL